MSERPWHHLGHPVRALLADIVVALVALSLLMENVRARHVGIRRIAYRPGSYVPINLCGFGWPMEWGTTPWDEGMLEGVVPLRLPAVWPFGERQTGDEVRAWALVVDAAAVLAMLAATAYATRRLLGLPRRLRQFSLLAILLLPAVVAVFAVLMNVWYSGLLVNAWYTVPFRLLAVFFWYAVACTVLAGVFLASWAVRRVGVITRAAPPGAA